MTLTALIPTYNRPEHLRRILQYLKKTKIADNIIVADSSKKKTAEENKKTCEGFPNTTYQHYPEKIVMWHKLALASKTITTDYAILQPDDDFYTPSGIKEAIKFLEKHKDYVAAHGRYACYTDGFKVRGLYANDSIDQDRGEERVKRMLSPYNNPALYSLRRAKDLKKILAQTAKHTDDFPFGELFTSTYTAAIGKIRKLPSTYMVRDASVKPQDYYKGIQLDILGFKKVGTLEDKYEQFKKGIVSAITGCKRQEAKDAVDNGFAHYLTEQKKHQIIGKGIRILAIARLYPLVSRIRKRKYARITPTKELLAIKNILETGQT